MNFFQKYSNKYMFKKTIIIVLMVFYSCNKKSNLPIVTSIRTIDEYHGRDIEDPYRNLENLKDSTVVNWLREQGKYAFDIIKSIPGRQSLIDRQVKYNMSAEFRIFDIYKTSDGAYFYMKILADEDISRLYYRPTKDGEEILLYDPSTYSNGDRYQISQYKPDWSGEKVAVGLSKKGGEIFEIIVIDVTTKNIFPEVITNCITDTKGIQWLSDNSGFIYLHVPVINPNDPEYWLNTRAVVYKIGEDSKKLNDVFSKVNNPKLSLNPEDFPVVRNQNPDDGYLFGIVSGVSSFNDIYFGKEHDLISKNIPWKFLCKQEDKAEKFVIYNDSLIFLSAKNTPNFQICKTAIKNPDFNAPEILVPEKEDQIITHFEITKDGLFFTTVKNGIEAKLFHLEGAKEKEIKLPNSSGRVSISAKGSNQSYLKISTGGYINLTTDYYYDVTSNNFTLEDLNPKIELPDFKNFTVEEIEVPSHDGVLIPLSIIRNKDCKKDGKNRTLFSGYGSYGSISEPYFDSGLLTWVTEGGILAIAHVRGGGEKGDTWHKAGFKTTKPNTWKDMIACTEFMIKEGYTSPELTAIWGSSAGGILAGRAMTERPDLYSAVILTSPALNMLRCEVQPNGQNSIKEFGTVKIKEEFEALLEMDSYHHIKKGEKYPATYVTGGMKDGTVVIWDPAKFVARLQASNASDKPILFGVNFEDGHAGMNNTRMEIFEMYADALSFALWQTGHPDYQPKE